MGGLLTRLKIWWETADKNQRLITVGGGAFLLLLMAGIFMFATKPKMGIAFAGLSPADTGMVAAEIQGMGIPVEYDQAGNVSVPQDRIPQVKATLAMNGKLPRPSNHLTKRDLNNMPVMAAPRVEEERLLAITEGQLAESIEMFSGVEQAQVHIAKGNDSPLLDRATESSANVTVAEKAGATITPDQGRAMAMLVASSVSGLDAAKVTIFSREGRAIWDGQEVSGSSGRAVTKLEMEKQFARQVRDDLQDQLNRIVGPGMALASVDVTLDLDKVNQSENTTTPTEDPISKESVKETMGMPGGNGAQGPVGAASNGLGGAASSTSSAGGDYKVQQERFEKGVSTIQKTIEKAPGELKSMGITVLVNSEKVVEASDLQKIEELAAAKLGPKAADTANFTSKVIAYKFDNTAQAAAAKDIAAASSSARIQQILSMAPILALIVVAFFVMKSLGKLGKTMANQPLAFAGAGGPTLPMSGSIS
ncbi:MAG TPA: flagellar M-ring protein FliF C-terminal domain-containing protein, partial [Fimbriimonadaceae bacterium]|nr:flagellar M-ring protein FliF C-terminal domain-containing protein [Fimbriimonadaceae bacterium]